MRSREEIEQQVHSALATVKENHAVLDMNPDRALAYAQLGVLLDIRELLQPKPSPKVKHADCAEPPEVKIK